MSELRGRLEKPEDMKRFLEAGNATITLVSVNTGTRFTYRFSKPKFVEEGKASPIFASVLTGQNNESDFSFLGTMFPRHFGQLYDEVKPSMRSRVALSSPSAVALLWFLRNLYGLDRGGQHEKLSQLEVWHEGRCGRCGRKLTVPESVSSGFGPECIQRVGG